DPDAKIVAHPHDPVLQAEHMDMLYLVKHADVTHMVVREGRWSEAATWQDGKIPTAGANVLVPRGKTVTVDAVLSPTLHTIRVDGKLLFAADRDTGMQVDTIVVTPSGHLVLGTAEAPIARDKRCRIVFTDRGPIDSRWDPHFLSRG